MKKVVRLAVAIGASELRGRVCGHFVAVGDYAWQEAARTDKFERAGNKRRGIKETREKEGLSSCGDFCELRTRSTSSFVRMHIKTLFHLVLR